MVRIFKMASGLKVNMETNVAYKSNINMERMDVMATSLGCSSSDFTYYTSGHAVWGNPKKENIGKPIE